jgi:hypothetical protein
MSSQHRNGHTNNGGSPQSSMMGNNNLDLDMMEMRAGSMSSEVIGHQHHATSNQVSMFSNLFYLSPTPLPNKSAIILANIRRG